MPSSWAELELVFDDGIPCDERVIHERYCGVRQPRCLKRQEGAWRVPGEAITLALVTCKDCLSMPQPPGQGIAETPTPRLVPTNQPEGPAVAAVRTAASRTDQERAVAMGAVAVARVEVTRPQPTARDLVHAVAAQGNVCPRCFTVRSASGACVCD